MAFWKRHDHEGYIGSYDPEHEMPDADREPRERYQSDAYRHNASDSRFAYRWNPDRFEPNSRDRGERSANRDWDRGSDRGWDREANRDLGTERSWHGREPRSDYELGYEHGRRDAELELYRRQHSGPFNRDPDREFNRGRNRAIDYDRDSRDRY